MPSVARNLRPFLHRPGITSAWQHPGGPRGLILQREIVPLWVGSSWWTNHEMGSSAVAPCLSATAILKTTAPGGVTSSCILGREKVVREDDLADKLLSAMRYKLGGHLEKKS